MLTAQKPRTDLNFEEFWKLLTKERHNLMAVHQQQHGEIVEESNDAAENELSGYVSGAADENTDTAAVRAEVEREEAMDENSQSLLRHIEHAMDRLDNGTYGFSEITGKPIPIARLRALPWATTNVEDEENGPV